MKWLEIAESKQSNEWKFLHAKTEAHNFCLFPPAVVINFTVPSQTTQTKTPLNGGYLGKLAVSGRSEATFVRLLVFSSAMNLITLSFCGNRFAAS